MVIWGCLRGDGGRWVGPVPIGCVGDAWTVSAEPHRIVAVTKADARTVRLLGAALGRGRCASIDDDDR
jgi:hypothetical protein